ncbi:hypothetical protein U1Q18_031570 [Sarracenia purpurea var. burkii]
MPASTSMAPQLSIPGGNSETSPGFGFVFPPSSAQPATVRHRLKPPRTIALRRCPWLVQFSVQEFVYIIFDCPSFVVLCFAFYETYTKIGLMYLISMAESPGSHCAAMRYPLLPHFGNLFPLYPLFLIFVACIGAV